MRSLTSRIGRIVGVAAMLTLLAPSAALAAGGGTYRNPVLGHDFPDPSVIRVGGWFYAYGTEFVTPTRHVNIQVARSRDLVHWRYLGDALPRLPAWGDDTGVSWAPDVVHRGGR